MEGDVFALQTRAREMSMCTRQREIGEIIDASQQGDGIWNKEYMAHAKVQRCGTEAI